MRNGKLPRSNTCSFGRCCIRIVFDWTVLKTTIAECNELLSAISSTVTRLLKVHQR